MALVGEFGAAKREANPDREPEQFGFFGEVFTVIQHDPGVGALMDFAEAMEAGADSHFKRLAAMKGLLRSCLDPKDFDRFWQSVLHNNVDTDTLLDVCNRVYEVISGRPTDAPSGSADGRSTTSPSSSPQSLRRAELGLVPVDAAALTG